LQSLSGVPKPPAVPKRPGVPNQGGGSLPETPITFESHEKLAEEVSQKFTAALDSSIEELSRCKKEKENSESVAKPLIEKINTLETDLHKHMSDAAKHAETLAETLKKSESTEALNNAMEEYKAITANSTQITEIEKDITEAKARLELVEKEIKSADENIHAKEDLITRNKEVLDYVETLRPRPVSTAQKGGSYAHPLLELSALISSAIRTLSQE